MLADSFDMSSDDEDDEDHHDTRNIRSEPSALPAGLNPFPATSQAQTTTASTSTSGRRVIGNGANDGVFANLSAKPSTNSEKPTEEHLPVNTTPTFFFFLPSIISQVLGHILNGIPMSSVFIFWTYPASALEE